MNKIVAYFKDIKTELKKSSWPWDSSAKGVKKYKELIDSTIVVLIAIILLGGYVSFVDFGLRQAISYLISLL